MAGTPALDVLDAGAPRTPEEAMRASRAGRSTSSDCREVAFEPVGATVGEDGRLEATYRSRDKHGRVVLTHHLLRGSGGRWAVTGWD
jgi:hypothetical protein